MLGGWLVQHLSWRWVFFINAAARGVRVAIALWRVPDTRRSRCGSRRLDRHRVDDAGPGAVVYALIESPPACRRGGHRAALIGSLRARSTLRFADAAAGAGSIAEVSSGANVLTLLLYAALSGVLFSSR